MKNMFGNETVSLFDLIREDSNGKTICKVCGTHVKYLYSTDKGYVCKEHK